MDPTTNLVEQRRIVARLDHCQCDYAEHDQALCVTCQHDAERLAELCGALDEWLTKGGALPDYWRR